MTATTGATDTAPVFDRIEELVPGDRAVAVRNIPNTLTFFDTHFPRHPILPGVLLLESMAALAKAAAGGERAWRLESVRAVRFKHFVGPGTRCASPPRSRRPPSRRPRYGPPPGSGTGWSPPPAP